MQPIPSSHGRTLMIVAALCLGCARDDAPTGPSAAARSSARLVTGRILGPDGSNICNTVGAGTLSVRLLNPGFAIGSGDAFLAAQDIACPDNRYSVPSPAGTAFLRVELPTEQIGSLPWRNLDEVAVGRTGAAHDVRVADGTPLGGTATLEGTPFEGASLTLGYDFNSSFGGAIGVTGTDGAWIDFFGRSPFLLQAGVRYRGTCDPVPGTRLLDRSSADGFLFPDERSAIDCAMVNAPSVQFSHTANRLVLTPMPADIGGLQSQAFLDQYGAGWGVQFPVQQGSTPVHDPSASHLFTGGLMIGFDPDSALAGVNVQGQMQCGAGCHELGWNATVKVTSLGSGRRQVTWKYTSVGRDLEITQISTDGRRLNDYVLFRFTIRNVSSSTRTFHAGFFGDWDLEADAGDDLGFTEQDGRLMYLVSQGESGIHAGTLLLGPPATGNYFFSAGQVPSTFDQVQALSGGLRVESGGPADLRYLQGAGPITLAPGRSQDLWIAVVVGETRTQLLANAAAAEAQAGGSSLP